MFPELLAWCSVDLCWTGHTRLSLHAVPSWNEQRIYWQHCVHIVRGRVLHEWGWTGNVSGL